MKTNSKRKVFGDAVDLLMSYVISSEGEEYCAMLDSEFAMKYKEYASKTIAMIGNKSERQIISQINKLSTSL